MERLKVGNNKEYQVCNCSIVGNRNRIVGNGNVITGNCNEIHGNANSITGNKNVICGSNNRVLGLKNRITKQHQQHWSASSAGSTPDEDEGEEEGDSDAQEDDSDTVWVGEVSVNICDRVRVTTSSSGQQSRENFHVELVEQLSSPMRSGRPGAKHKDKQQDKLYDLSELDGEDSDAAGSGAAPACAVCLRHERCVKLSPCRHVPLCLACSRQMFAMATNSAVPCPICRCPVRSLERLFFT